MFKHPYKDFLLTVSKPARYLGGEWGEIKKLDSKPCARMCLVFPDIYEIGMSYLGFKILYALLNADDDIEAQRCFSPWVDMEAELRKRNMPLVSLETHTPLGEFDALGFSFQHELSYTNFLNILDLSNIPLRTDERTASHPLIIGGGPMASNPEPLADFVDIFYVGDAEKSLVALIKKHHELKSQNTGRREILIELAKFKGVYAPSLYETAEDEQTGLTFVTKPIEKEAPATIERSSVKNMDEFPFPAMGPVPHVEASFDRLSVEIMRGCDAGCRFCLAGSIYRPMRLRNPQSIADTISKGLRFAGYDEASFTSLSTSDYPFLAELLGSVAPVTSREGVSLAVSSLRAYGLDDKLFDTISGVRKTGLTFAPEAGSERLRRVINKNITDEDIEQSVRSVFSKRWQKIKLYFMLGLPTETDDDVTDIIALARRLLSIARDTSGKRAAITVSVSSFVPKTQTPFQWCAMDTIDEIERKQRMLISGRPPRAISIKWHNRYVSHIEGIFARGDRKLCRALELAFKKGARFDSWDEHFDFAKWQEAFSEAGIDTSMYLKEFPLDSRLPWGHIKMGYGEKYLKEEYKKSLEGEPTDSCGLNDDGEIICRACGAPCDIKFKFDRLKKLKEEFKNKKVKVELSGDVNGGVSALKRFRITYTKLDAVKYLGHLDTIRAIQRTFRRAGIKMKMTGGFNRQPEMAYAPPLMLGLESVCEILDAAVFSGASGHAIIDLLNEHSIDGLRFIGATALPEKAKKITSEMLSSTYAVFFKSDEKTAVQLERHWRDMKNSLPVIVTDKRDRQIDITGILPGLRKMEPGEVAALQKQIGEKYDEYYAFDIPFTDGPKPYPDDVANAIFPQTIVSKKRIARLTINL